MALPRVGPLVATALLLYLSFPHFAHAIPLDFFVQATASNTVVSGVGDCSTGSVACSGNFDSGLLQASGVDLPGTILLTQPPALSGSASVSGFARLPNAVGRTGAELSLSAGTGADHSALSQPNFAGPSSASSLGFAQLGDKLTAVADLLPSLLLSKGSEVTLIATLESSLSVGPGAVANGDGAKFSGKGSAFFAAGLNDTTLRTVDSSANVVLAPQIRRIPFTVPLGEPVPISTILNVEAKANAGTLPDSNATVRTTGDVTLFIDSLTPGISYTTASNRDYRLCDSKCLFLLRQAQFNTAADIMNRISDKVDKVDPIGGWITRKVDQAIDRVLKDVAPDVPDGPTTVLLKETVHQGLDQVLEALPTSPAKPVQEVASWLSIGAKTLADLHRFLGNDPFDPNFAQVAQPIFGILPPTTLVSVAPQLLFVFRDVEGQADNFLAYSIALSVSFNRYLSALQANDGQSAAVQLGAINQYLELYLSAQKLLGVAIASLRAEILREQADVAIDAAGFMAFQAQIRTNGLPTDIRNALRDAGASDADIADLIATFLAVDSDSWPSGTLTDALGILSDDFSEDLTPQATPEPTTLLLFGTTMAGLGLAARRRRRRSKQSRGV